MKTISFNQTENIIQNFCVKFSHNFNHQYSRITNHFVIKGAPITKENALEITEILFPKYTDIIIESIENDEMTLTPAEYELLRSLVNEKRQSSLRGQEIAIKEGRQEGPLKDTDWDAYLLKLINKMDSRMDQFPVYHT